MRLLLLPYQFLVGTLVLTQSNFLLAQENNPSPTQTVRIETCWNYPIENNAPSKEGYISIQTQYNADGKKSQMTTYKTDGTIAYEYFFEYQDQMRECYWKMLDGTKIKSEIEHYNDNGQILTRIRYATDGSILDKQTFEYEKRQKTKETYYNDKEEAIYGIAYSYNSEKNTIREVYTNYINDEQTIGAIELGMNALPSSYVEYRMSGPVVRKVIYERDQMGKVLLKRTYASDNELDTKEICKYSSNTTQCSVYIEEGKQLVEHIVYTYDYYQE